jgi:hypothetical protein
MKIAQKLYIGFLSLIILGIFVYLTRLGYQYYKLPIEERFFHPDHNLLKPGGIWGHGLGIIGTLCIILGIVLYMARKRARWMSRMGILRYWLEFHIFLCTLGPILILFHTSFKFGGLVALSFWSMVAVFLSGVIGRFIYIQIPRTIEGRELSLAEVRAMKTDIGNVLSVSSNLDEESYNTVVESTRKKIEVYQKNMIIRYFRHRTDDNRTLKNVKSVIRKNKLNKRESKKIVHLVKHEINLNRKIDRLASMQKIFSYWHVAHFPFAIIMLIIMVIHVAVTITFGYRWIF